MTSRTQTLIFRSIDEIPAGFGPSVAAIGNFDGVHLGHQAILNSVCAEAKALGVGSVAITFDPHPERFLRPATAPRLLTPLQERLRLLASTGLGAVLVLPFDARLAALSARAFVEQTLVERLRIVSLHEGGNFRFGRRAEAGTSDIEQLGHEFGFRLKVHGPVSVHQAEVSSSAIRALVAAGDMRRARWMLGRPFAIVSTQERGRGVGTRLLVPTVNLSAYTDAVPAFGVYATRLGVAGRAFNAVTNVGNRPTFEGVGFGIETHILNFEPVDMDETTPLRLEFLLRLREERQWPSPDALKAQIMRDVARAQRYFRLLPRD